MKISLPPLSQLENFRLVQLEHRHLAAWYAYLTNSSVIEHTSWNIKTPEELSALIDMVQSSQTETHCRLAIIDEISGDLAGTIGMHSMSRIHRNAEIAYDLAIDYWGRGIATAMCRTVTAWAFGYFDLLRVQATVLESNLQSARVLEKCGFQYEGYLRAYRMVRGRSGNFLMYARLNSDQMND